MELIKIEGQIDQYDIEKIKEQMYEMVEMNSELSVETPSHHHFTDGLYTRETHMMAGTIAIGKKHRYSVTNILIKGKISVIMDDYVTEWVAPCVFVSEPGVSKIAYFHEDTIWLNCHPTDETDLEKIEADVIISENEELEWDG